MIFCPWCRQKPVLTKTNSGSRPTKRQNQKLSPPASLSNSTSSQRQNNIYPAPSFDQGSENNALDVHRLSGFLSYEFHTQFPLLLHLCYQDFPCPAVGSWQARDDCLYCCPVFMMFVLLPYLYDVLFLLSCFFAQKHKNTKTQKHKNTKTQKHENTNT